MDLNKLQEALNECSSREEILSRFNITLNKSSYIKLWRTIKDNKLDTTRFKQAVKKLAKTNAKSNPTVSDNEIFCENSKYSRQMARHRIFKNNLIECKCLECGIIDTYNNKPINLQVDHINGVDNDHRLQNLRLLCPNCHSQTPTYARAKGQKVLSNKCQCGSNKHRLSKLCSSCRKVEVASIESPLRIFNPELNDFTSKLNEFNWNFTKLSEFYKVSDKAISKRCLRVCSS